MEQVKGFIGQCDLTEQDCSKVVTDLHLDSISRSCCTRDAWKTLAPHLEIERAVVDDIDRKQVEEKEKRSNFFYKWKQMKGSGATYLKLVSALLKIEHMQDAEEVLRMLQGSSSSSQQFSSMSSQHSIEATSQATPAGDPDSPFALSPSLTQDLKQQLRFNLNRITEEYTQYVECIRKSICKKGISASDLCTFLLTKPVFNYDDNDYKLFSDRKDELEQFTEVNQVFNLLITEYSSFINYDIFTSIVYNFELNQGQKEFNYPEHLEKYIEKQKVSEFLAINPALAKLTSASKEVFLKLDIAVNSKLAKVKNLTEAIADKMKWQPSIVRILDINEGCVIVTLLIPAFLADCIFVSDNLFNAKEKEDFLQLNVLWMKCNGFIYHFSDQQPDNTLPSKLVMRSDHEWITRKLTEKVKAAIFKHFEKNSKDSDINLYEALFNEEATKELESFCRNQIHWDDQENIQYKLLIRARADAILNITLGTAGAGEGVVASSAARAAAGGGIGAGVGALIGSLGGPIGMAIGAAIGAAFGAATTGVVVIGHKLYNVKLRARDVLQLLSTDKVKEREGIVETTVTFTKATKSAPLAPGYKMIIPPKSQ